MAGYLLDRPCMYTGHRYVCLHVCMYVTPPVYPTHCLEWAIRILFWLACVPNSFPNGNAPFLIFSLRVWVGLTSPDPIWV